MNHRARRGVRAARGAVVFLASLTSVPATADSSAVAGGRAPSLARLSLDGCVPVSRVALDQLLALELDGNDRPSALSDAHVDVNVECLDEQLVRLTVERAGAGRQARAVRLYDVPPDARPRLLALGIVELIVSSGEVAPPAGVPIAMVGVASMAVPSPPARWRIDAGGSLRAFTRNWGQPMVGGTVGVTRTWPGTHSAAGIHVALETSEQAASLGRVTAVVASAAPCYHLFGEHGRWRYGLASGLRLGWARLAGVQPATEVRTASFGRWWAGPMLAARLDATWGAHGFAGAGFEVGKMLQSVRGVVGGRTEIELGGLWLSAVITVGLRL